MNLDQELELLGKQSNGFGYIVALWNQERVTEHLADSILLVKQYASFAIASADRIEIVIRMSGALRPIDFTSRLEPRTSIANAWRDAAEAASSKFFASINELLRRDTLAWGHLDVQVLLELLSEAGLEVPPFSAFLAQTRLKLDFDRTNHVGSLGQLIMLLPNDAGSIFSMLERLARDDMLRPSAVQAAIRKIARWDPGNLERALALFASKLFLPDDYESGVSRFFVEDLIERAGSKTVMLAMCGVNPDLSRELMAGAFSGNDAPFSVRIRRHGAEDDSLNATTFIDDGQNVIALGHLHRGSGSAEWLLKVRLLTRFVPIVDVSEITHLGEGELDTDDASYFDDEELDCSQGYTAKPLLDRGTNPHDTAGDEDDSEWLTKLAAKRLHIRRVVA